MRDMRKAISRMLYVKNMWFIYTIITIFMWSGSDLFSKLGSGASDRLSHFKITGAVGLAMGLHALYMITLGGVDFKMGSILVYFPVSFLYILSMLLGYVGLRYVFLSVSSPICNSSGAVSALLCFLFLGQRMSVAQFCAVAVICIGIMLLAAFQRKEAPPEGGGGGQKASFLSVLFAILPRDRQDTGDDLSQGRRISFLAILFPILYCIIDGVATFTDAYYLEHKIDEYSANIAYELTFFIVGAAALIYVFGVKRERLIKRDVPKAVGAVFETAGQFFYVFALSANAIVAAPTIASYSVFSVLWSRLFLKEKLSAKHYAVIGAVMAGIAALAVFE